MQLDQTKLVMRPRSISEVGDLTLAMLRTYPRSILIGFALGASVWAVFNFALLAWIPIREANLGITDEEALLELYRYLGWMTLLILLQTPIAGVLATLFLGRAIFEDQMNWKQVVKEVWGHRYSLFVVLLLRGLVLPAMLVLFTRIGKPASFLWDVLCPMGFLTLLFFTRGMSPFVPEILLLEKCPLRSRHSGGITLRARSGHLHHSLTGENGGRFLIQGFVNLLLVASIFLTLMAFRGILLLRWDFLNLSVFLVLFPLCLWIVAAISVVARLLFYLDARLRLEGWDVELLVRAEVFRQFNQSSPLRSVSNASPSTFTTQNPSGPTAESTMSLAAESAIVKSRGISSASNGGQFQ